MSPHPAAPTCLNPTWVGGVSLVELLVVVALLGMLASLAAPSFTGLMHRYRVDAVREELLASLQLARVEAIRQNASVIVERQTGCSTVLATGNNWSCGWLLYADKNDNNSRDTQSEPIIQISKLPSQVALHKSANPPLTRVTADRFGQLQPLALHFLIKPEKGDEGSNAILCMGAGARFRWVKGASTCS